jgi:hydroxyethylthiazole kinase
VIGAFAGVDSNYLRASLAALTFYGIAAEKAVEQVGELGPGSFQIQFLNQLALVSSDDIHRFAQFKHV